MLIEIYLSYIQQPTFSIVFSIVIFDFMLSLFHMFL